MKVEVRISYVKESEGFISLMRHFASGFLVEAKLGIYDLEDLKTHIPDEACKALSEGKKVSIRNQDMAFKILRILRHYDVKKHQIHELILEPMA